MIKKLLCLLLSAMMLFSLSGCTNLIDTVVGSAVFFYLCATDNDDRADKDEIFAFVSENEEALREAVESKDYSDFENKGIVQDINPDEECIEFSCGGAGMGPSTAYTGFYYTPNNDMSAVWCAPPSEDFLKKSGNGYAWEESGTDNRYYTEKICENFYYYESEF